MGWATLQDIRELPLWKNHHAVVLYSYIAMAADYSTRETKRSIRTMARQCQMTVGAVRHALGQLQRSGLIEVYSTAAQTTCVLPSPKSKPAGVTWDQAADIIRENLDNIARTMQLPTMTVETIAREFCSRQELSGKTWKDSRDLLSHLVNWYYRQPTKQVAKLATQSRQLEAAAEEEQRKKQAWEAQWMQNYDYYRETIAKSEKVRDYKRLPDGSPATAEQIAWAIDFLSHPKTQRARQVYAELGHPL